MSEITRDQMQAYADGQLDPAERRRLEAALDGRPEIAAEIAQIQRQSDAIRTLYGPVASEPVPNRLDISRLARAGRARRMRLGAAVAATFAMVAIGMAGGWLLRDRLGDAGPADRLIASAVSAHTVFAAEGRHAVEVEGTDSAHLSQWLSSRLETRLAMPDLSASGLSFLGGRLLPAPESPGGRAAQLMYQDEGGERLTLYITPAAAPDAPRYQLASLGLDTALYWADDLLTCTITAPYDADRLETIARSVFAQLSPRDSGYSP